MIVFFCVALYLFIMGILSNKVVGSNARVLFLAGSVTTLFVCLAGLFFSLPFSGADAIRFERVAWEWAQGSFSDVLATFDVTRSYLISSITALFYYFTGREIIIPIMINGIMGLFISYIAIKLADEVWPNLKSKRNTYVFLVVFSLMLTINSAIILRENYITLLLVCATYSLAKYINHKNYYHLLMFFAFCVLSSFFHGGTILYALGLPAYLFLFNNKIKLTTKIVWMVIFVFVLLYVINNMHLGKFSNVESSEDFYDSVQTMQEASTSYIGSMVPNNLFDVVWQTPVRMWYFLTKPYLWDVRNFGHLIAFFDAVIWFGILFLMYKNRHKIKQHPVAMAIFLCCLIDIFAFAYGTSNFGTALRHRTKFYIAMLVIVAPFLPSFKLSKK